MAEVSGLTSSSTNSADAIVRTVELNRNSKYSYDDVTRNVVYTGRYTVDTMPPIRPIGTTISQYWVPKL